MADIRGLRLAIAGAGAFGLCVALRAAAGGAVVELWEPQPLGDNASGVAAGMIAPVGEVLFDDLGPAHIDLLRAGRDGWRDIERLAPGLGLDRSGAVFLFGSRAERDAAETQLKTMGAAYEASDQALEREDRCSPMRYGLWTSEDWRLDPLPALAALRAAFIQAGGVVRTRALDPADLGRFDAVVVAAGVESRAFASLAPELCVLSPIKGQLVRFRGGPMGQLTIRTKDIYLVPQASCTLAGATMEAGRSDRTIDNDRVGALRRRALDLVPDLAALPFEGSAGVRAATPDGLPMAGPSSRPSLFLATGARRNGWLLAPLVSEIVVSYLSGGDGGSFAARLDPRRFVRA